MGDPGLVLVAVAVAVGIVGIVLPVLPGTLLVAAATLVWALVTGGEAWWWWAGVVAVLVAGQVAMYLVPGRRMTRAGIRTRSLLLGGLLGVVGFFVVPVLGLVLGFVLGVFLAELARAARSPVGSGTGPLRPAVASTVVALKNVGLSILIEGSAALLAALVWVAGALVLR
ncbi:DUF456 domain-containing protein [Kineococcus sp. SYSU DK004]|uniref:DUF456 domain-containing protein n=1 Tax=Kineococcus sp. SYSU DK004 TaxID=3383125 RepID=UPI003D7E916E